MVFTEDRNPDAPRICFVTLTVAVIAILICPFPWMDSVIGGLAGTAVAQVSISRRFSVGLLGGLIGGLVTLLINMLTIMVVWGHWPVFEGGWWALILFAAVVVAWSIPGIVIAMLINPGANRYPAARTGLLKKYQGPSQD